MPGSSSVGESRGWRVLDWGLGEGRLTRLSTLEPRVCPTCAFRRAGLTHRCVLAQNECGWQELVRIRRVWAEARHGRVLGTAWCGQEAVVWRVSGC